MGKGYGIPCLKAHFKAYDNGLTQFTIMKLVSSGTVDHADTATVLPIGVLVNKPEAAGWPAEVVVLGECKLKAGGSITAGQFLVATTDGKAVAITIATLTTNCVVGRALEDADSDDIFRAMVHPGFAQVGT